MMKVTKISREERFKRFKAGNKYATFVGHKNTVTDTWISYQLPTDEIVEQHQIIEVVVDLSEVAPQDKLTIARKLAGLMVTVIIKDENGNVITLD